MVRGSGREDEGSFSYHADVEKEWNHTPLFFHML